MTHNDFTHANVKNIPVWNHRLGPFFAGVAIILGVVFSFAVNWLLGLLLIFGGVASIVVMMSQIAKSRTAEFETSCQQWGVTYKPNLSDPEAELFLGLSENDARVLMQFRVSDFQVKETLINIREILNVELIVNDLSVYKAGPIASLSGAALCAAPLKQ